ncbi:MAG: hypothetical protein AAFU63_12830 [Pseudomonadota bacterium]
MTVTPIITGAPLRPHVLSAMDAVRTVFQSAGARHVSCPVNRTAHKPAKLNSPIAAPNPRSVAPARWLGTRTDPTLARDDDTTRIYRHTLEAAA